MMLDGRTRLIAAPVRARSWLRTNVRVALGGQTLAALDTATAPRPRLHALVNLLGTAMTCVVLTLESALVAAQATESARTARGGAAVISDI